MKNILPEEHSLCSLAILVFEDGNVHLSIKISSMTPSLSSVIV